MPAHVTVAYLFLEASDGWREMGPFVWTMRTTADVGWLRDLEPVLSGGDDPDAGLLDRALLVSAESDVTFWLLDPADVNEDGEWAAYVWASWYPGLDGRFDSFAGLVARSSPPASPWPPQPTAWRWRPAVQDDAERRQQLTRTRGWTSWSQSRSRSSAA